MAREKPGLTAVLASIFFRGWMVLFFGQLGIVEQINGQSFVK